MRLNNDFMIKKMNICIIGCNLNTDYILRTSECYDDFELIGCICDIAEQSPKFTFRDKCINYFETFSDVLKINKPDIVYLAAINDNNIRTAEDALHLGCAVFIFSPYRLLSADINSLYEIASTKHLPLIIDHPYLYNCNIANFLNKIKQQSSKDRRNISIKINHRLVNSDINKYVSPNVISEEYYYPGGVFHKDIYYALYVIINTIGPISDFSVKESSSGILPQNISDRIEIKCVGQLGDGFIHVAYSMDSDCFQIKSIVNEAEIISRLDSITYEDKKILNYIMKYVHRFVSKSECQSIKAAKIRDISKLIVSKNDQNFSMENIISVHKLADKIWSRIEKKYLDFNGKIPFYTDEQNVQPRVLVTGASGSLGKVLVNQLILNGYKVRALVRKLSRTSVSCINNIEIFYGDISDIASLEAAFIGVDYIVHAAADTLSTVTSHDTSTIDGTKNILLLCGKYHVKKLVYISTCNVYGVADYESGYQITENSPLELNPELRGSYTYNKLISEKLVQEEIIKGNINAVCIRPGTYFGEGVEYFTPLMGFSLKNRLFITIGHNDLRLPLVCVDNVASAILEILKNRSCVGKTYNIVDENQMTKKQYTNIFIKKLFPNAIFLHISFGLLCFIIQIQEVVLSMIGIKPFLTKYRFISSQNNVIYESVNIHNDLNWKSPCDIIDNMESILDKKKLNIKKGCNT